jgi:hypothetical protein
MAAVANTLHNTVAAVLVPFPNTEEIITMFDVLTRRHFFRFM